MTEKASIVPEDADIKLDGQEISLRELRDNSSSGNGVDEALEEHKRDHFSPLALIGLSFAMLNSWVANSGSMYIGLASGGPVSVVYGNIFGTLAALTIATSLAEICRVFPTAGAQYHWSFLLADKSRSASFLSYMSGWLATLGWISLASTAPYFGSAFCTTVAQTYQPTFVPGFWFSFVIYVVLLTWGLVVSCFGVKMMNKFTTFSLFWSILTLIAIIVTLLACAGSRGALNSGKFIFATFLNYTGWPDGVAWIMGLLQTQYCLVGADGAAHIVDEVKDPRRDAPLAMVLSCAIGGVTSFCIIIAILATITDPLAVVQAQGGANFIAILQGVGSLAGATILVFAIFSSLVFVTPSLFIAASRMVQAFANDRCMPAHKHIARTSTKWETPIGATLVAYVCMIVIALTGFGSPLALVAIQSASVVCLQLSYMPSLLLMLFGGRDTVKNQNLGHFLVLGPRWGPIINVVALIYLSVTTVFFMFPSIYPLTSAKDLNWGCVVLGAFILSGIINWFLYARKTFEGPSNFSSFIESEY